MRTLAFTSDQKTIFDALHVAIYKCPIDFSKEELRLIAKLQDLFEEASEESHDTNGIMEKTLKKDGTSFKVEEAQWKVLNKAFKGTPWTAQFAKKYVEVEDYLELIKEEKPS
jgi:hypothetical protein